jgi:NAD(P)-dependent dehydrogenase (short-subunit alcohol dehydrogenase family)
MTVSVVTGSSTGIGFATALRLARDGHTVHASVRSEGSGEALLEAAGDLDVRLLVMDVDDDRSVADGLGAVVADGGVDVLVNNAGITAGHCVEETPMATFQAVMNTNAWGTLRCIQAVLPSMRERGSGRIVNVTSAAGRIGNATQGAYCMSKWAAEALTECLAAEVTEFGIQVSAVEPGVIVTPIFEKAMHDLADPRSPYAGANQRVGEWFLQSLVAGSPLAPEAVADAIADVLQAEDPPLRTIVGEDAQALVAWRDHEGHDAWIAQSSADDDEWWAWMTDVTKVPRPAGRSAGGGTPAG